MATYAQFIQFGPYFSGGALQAGIKVYHYVAGTTTLKNVYTDRAKLTTAAQPVMADSQGIASFYADGIYKFVIKDANDATLYTYDNVNVADVGLTGEGAAISSASTLTLGTDGTFFHVTGSVAIAAISGTQSFVTLCFDATPTLTNSGSLILLGGVNYTVTANDVIQFVNEGSDVWREITRGNPTVGAIPTTVGSTGQSLRVTAPNTIAFGAPHGMISGLTYGNSSVDATNDLDFAAGEVSSDDASYASRIVMSFSAMTKQSDAAWAVGTNQGALDTGAVGNNSYFIWVIGRTNTGVNDILFSLSSTSPTMPTNYTKKRLIGWFKRSAGAIVAFHTYELQGGGLEFSWDTGPLDVNLANTLTTTRRLDALSVPVGFTVQAMVRILINDAVGANAIVQNPDEVDAAPSVTAAPLSTLRIHNASTAAVWQGDIRTNVSGQVAARGSTVMDSYQIVTMGFKWGRR